VEECVQEARAPATSTSWRNEGSVAAETIAAHILPAGATRRIDAPDRGFCEF
jgi:hypothetical protein